MCPAVAVPPDFCSTASGSYSALVAGCLCCNAGVDVKDAFLLQRI
jgi:hypothetical protein